MLIVGTALGWFPLGDDPLVRHVPRLAGVLMIGQGTLWVVRSRTGQDGS
ncbi:hypothetical protein [Kitasatospora sp. NPDC093679]